MKRTVKAGAAACAVAAAACHASVAVADGGVYFGGNAGYTLSSYSRHAMDSGLAGQFSAAGDTLTIDSSATSKSTTDWSAELGYMFSPYVGIEAAYLQLGAIHYGASGTIPNGAAALQTNVTVDVHSRGPALMLRGVLPLTQSWFVDAHLGAYDGHTRSSFTTAIDASSSSGGQSKTSTSLLAQAGTGYVFGAHWTVQADFVYINRIKDEVLGRHFNVEQLTAGLTYSF